MCNDMTKEEKEKKIVRLHLRMLRFQLLVLYSQKYNESITHNINKFDNITESVLQTFKPAFHLRLMANQLIKLRAIKTI